MNIMIVGVGGQGSLLASRILGRAALDAGYAVKVSEVHGMSQRGGSVVAYVKYGETVDAPLICRGEADVILSFEQLEAARWLPYLRRGGTVVTSTQSINPMPVVTGAAIYPDALVEKIAAKGVRIIAADTLAIAREAGSEKAANVALIGLAGQVLGFDDEALRAAITACVPPKFTEVNLKAYSLGAEQASAR